jgi:hypothetical protein
MGYDSTTLKAVYCVSSLVSGPHEEPWCRFTWLAEVLRDSQLLRMFGLQLLEREDNFKSAVGRRHGGNVTAEFSSKYVRYLDLCVGYMCVSSWLQMEAVSARNFRQRIICLCSFALPRSSTFAMRRHYLLAAI